MKRMETLRIGLIGCGEHSQENLIPSLWALKGAKVDVVCDASLDAAADAGHRLGAKVQCDFAKLIENEHVDAVVIAATPQVHFAAALMALKRGLHVFVEKPPTVTLDELSQLTNEARKGKLVTCVGHNLRHTTAAIEMQSVINPRLRVKGTERFGRPLAMEMRYLASKPRGDRWGLNSPLRSFLLSHANHAIDFMIYQMGPIDRVNAALASSSDRHQGIALSAQFIFKSGAVGNLLATSFSPHFSISGMIVSDRSRVVELNSLHQVVAYGLGDDRKRWGRQWISKSLLTGYEPAGYLTELQLFVNAATRHEPEACQPSFAEELAVYDAIDEIERKIASEAGRPDSRLLLAAVI